MCFPDAEKIELFARTKGKGWKVEFLWAT